jgi:hypothetical protein
MIPDLQRRSIWRASVAATALNAIGTPLDLVVGHGINGLPYWPPLASSAIGAVLCAALLWKRRTRPRWLSSGAFLFNIAVIVFALRMTDAAYSTVPAWVPYQAHKLGALTVALLAPEGWVGVLSILAVCGEAIIHYLTLPASIQVHVFGEPGSTVAYGIFALALLAVQVRRQSSERLLAETQAETLSMERLAKTALAIRDLANTPLQTIELSLALLRRLAQDAPSDWARHLDQIDRAFERLRDLNRILDRAGHTAPGVARESFDAQAILEGAWPPGKESK